MGIIDSFLDRVVANSRFGFEDVVLSPDQLAWINDDECNDLESYPGPGWDDPDRYEPSLLEEAEEFGYSLGWHREARPGAADLSLSTSAYLALVRGYDDGRARRDREEREQLEYEARLDELARDREAELERYAVGYYHEDEVIRALGAIEARKGVGS